jgi:post-segregation antitoxin (ccd killing protein)
MYVLSLYELPAEGARRQLISVNISDGTSWTLNNLRILSSGTFEWQIEAVSNRNGRVERNGTPGVNTFVVDIPLPSINADRPGILYGN